MAFSGILNEAEVKAALDSCSGEISNFYNIVLFSFFFLIIVSFVHKAQTELTF